MMRCPQPRAPRLFALLLTVFLPGAMHAGEPKADVAARFIPADAAIYASSLRLKDQFDIVAKSRAWKAIKEMPAIRDGWQAAQIFLNAPGGPFDKFDEFKKDPDNAALIETVINALSHEVFYMGGDSLADLVDLFGRVQTTNRFGPLLDGLQGRPLAQDEAPKVLLRGLLENRDLIKSPEFLIGFKVHDVKRVGKQIERLQAYLDGAGLNAFVKSVKIRGAAFLSAELTGDMLPWELIPFDNFADQPGDFVPLVKKLKSLKLNVSLGVTDGYLVVAMGPSNAFLEKFGGPGKRLIDVPEFHPLAKHAAKRLVSVAYTSKSFRARAAGSGAEIEELLSKVIEMTPDDVADAKVRKKLKSRLKDLGKRLQVSAAAVGAELSYSYLTGTGYELFHYDWTKRPDVDSSKPLTLLHHVGGAPLLAVVAHVPNQPGDYDELVTGLKEFGELIDEASASWSEEKKKEYARIAKAVRPLLARLNDTTGQLLVPALAEGQCAIVVDAKWSSNRWHKDMPVFNKPLPMPELGLILGVSDSGLLEKAMKNYAALIEDGFTAARDLFPNNDIPKFKFPKAVQKQGAASKLWTWLLPAELGIDPRVAPTLGVSNKVGVAAASEDHAERLLKSTPLKYESKLLDGIAERKVAQVVIFDWARLVDVAEPWAEFATAQILRERGMDDPQDAAPILDQVRTVLSVLKCFRNVAAITYHEGNAIVTRSEAVIRDLPEGKK